MIINKLDPQGYCAGVKNAIKIALNTNGDNVYCLGALIHNKEMIKKLTENGITTIMDNGRTRLEMLDDIKEGTVIISAHGASPLVFKKAMDKGLKIVDATCGFVKMTHNEIGKYLSLGYDVYYIGTPKHPECEGAIGISDKIKLISSIDDINNIKFNDKSFIINQTTLSLYDIKELHEAILKKNPNVIINDSICSATTLRQKAVINQPKADLTIIVGDKMSSNSKKLYKLSSLTNQSIMIETVNDIKDYNFTNIHTINITSGASTPDEITEEIIKYIEKK